MNTSLFALHALGMLRRAMYALLIVAMALSVGSNLTRAAEAIPGITVSMSQPVVPLLIRNENSSLLRVVVNSGKIHEADVFERNDVRVTSLTFTLEGTDDLGDLESLTLYSTGAADDLIATRHGGSARNPTVVPVAISGAMHSAPELTVATNFLLRPGKNVFWLSARLKRTANLEHRVAASCLRIETSAGELIPHDDAPGVRHRIGVAVRKSHDDDVDTYAIPALATTSAGTLLCVYDMRRRFPGHDLQDDIDTGLSRSVDGGKTWEPVRVIMGMGEYGGLPEEQNGVSDPGIIVDRQTGDIYVFAAWLNGKVGHHQWVDDGSEPGFEIGKTAQLMMVHSRDDGRTWTKPENLTRKLKQESWWLFTTSPQQGIQLEDGTLVMPMEGRFERGKPGIWGKFATIMTSHDHGATWTVGSMGYRLGSENQAVELGDGSIMINVRNDDTEDPLYLYRGVAVTRDLGKTWQKHPTDRKALIEPNCNASLIRVDYLEGGEKKHVLLFSNPHSHVKRQRVNQTIQVSFDDGMTWPEKYHVLLDQGNGWGYPSLSQIDADHVGIVYGGSQADVVFQVVSLDELLKR